MCKKGLLLVISFCLVMSTAGVSYGFERNKSTEVKGVGENGDGAGVAIYNLDDNARPEMILMAYDDPDEENTFRYRIGWNMGTDGKTVDWSESIEVDGCGYFGDGAGVALCNLDDNVRPEMILMAYDNTEGANNFRYRVGKNLGKNGKSDDWGDTVYIEALGDRGSGADIAVVNLDEDVRPEIVLMAYDATPGGCLFRYYIGWNVAASGRTGDWGNVIEVDGLGYYGDGAGMAFCNLDDDERPEMVLMAYDNPDGANSFRYKIGWNLDKRGKTFDWRDYDQIEGVGHRGDGAGLAVYNIDGNVRPDMVFMAYDNPERDNNFRYKIGWNATYRGNISE